MKKLTVFTLLVVLGCGLFYMVSHIIRAKKKADIATRNKQLLPNFSLFDLNGVRKNADVIKHGASVIIIYFNSDCEYCQSEAKQLKANISMLEGVQIIMVSFNTNDQIKKFAKIYQLDQCKQVVFLRDKEFKFTRWFGNCSIPSVFVYNSQHRLVKEFYGEVKIAAIKKLI